MRLATTAALLCVALAACAISRDDSTGVAQRPQALLDAYLIAHGMAASYVEAPEADPAVVMQLYKLDMRAAAAVSSLGKRPDGDLSATAGAVAALTDYAARQSGSARQ